MPPTPYLSPYTPLDPVQMTTVVEGRPEDVRLPPSLTISARLASWRTVLGEILLLGELLCPAGFSAKKKKKTQPPTVRVPQSHNFLLPQAST